jgi:hypothetical protein
LDSLTPTAAIRRRMIHGNRTLPVIWPCLVTLFLVVGVFQSSGHFLGRAALLLLLAIAIRDVSTRQTTRLIKELDEI